MWQKISLCSFSVMHTTCPYRLESPSGLTVCIVSRLNQQIKVMCRCSLLKCKVCTVKVIDLVKIEALWMARIWGDAITLMIFSLGPPLLSRYSGFLSATLVEHVVRLTCFFRVWCEWYGLNVLWWCMWWFVRPACRKLTQPGWGCTIIV